MTVDYTVTLSGHVGWLLPMPLLHLELIIMMKLLIHVFARGIFGALHTSARPRPLPSGQWCLAPLQLKHGHGLNDRVFPC